MAAIPILVSSPDEQIPCHAGCKLVNAPIRASNLSSAHSTAPPTLSTCLILVRIEASQAVQRRGIQQTFTPWWRPSALDRPELLQHANGQVYLSSINMKHKGCVIK